MERNLEQYYLKFKRPPMAPTYYPTEDEFSDPIGYVAKIKMEAEKYGVVKIVPPESFRPPFVIDSARFEFTPRVQKLNEIDALFRVRIIFINKLVNFWHLQGQQFRLPWVENKYIDVYQLRKYVDENGGMEQVTSDRKWMVIAKRLGFKGASGANLKQNYTRWIHPYVKSIEKVDNNNENDGMPSTSQVDDTEMNGDKMESTSVVNASETPASSILRRSSRMMAGVKPQATAPTLAASTTKRHLSVELVYCAKCGGGDDENRLLICETCDRSLHIYCLDPPLARVPRGDWRCPQCVMNAVKKFSFEFGFFDSQTKFNLNTFGEWANNFKQTYFKQAPCDVPAEMVENEFWRNVVNMDKDISVKYGADLITSKMGSGFPRKTDTFRGIDAKEQALYANHPWNLNNLPVLRESVLSHINTDISGMMVPWVYVGMCFSTFCWHVEDHWTYSINYNHWGERKIWYGLSGDDAERFDDFFRQIVPELFTGQVDLLHHMTTALNPRFLIDHGIPIYTVHQNPGEFVITFPRAYHSGYNEGLNFAEAVNFAPPDWLRMGRLCLSNYASVRRTCVFSHEELIMQMVKITDRMSIQMCLSTLEELRYIVGRETNSRRRLTAGGLHESEFRQFESIPDDERSCFVCRTTLYISALVCRHRKLPLATGGVDGGSETLRIVCMDHIDDLCDVCQLSDCCLLYRYSMEDFISLAEKLSQRTNDFEEWRHKIEKMSRENGCEKINIKVLRSLMETWKAKRYPHCKEVFEIMDRLSRFDKLAGAVSRLFNRKIRLRDNTRCQKADNRYDFEELQQLQRELAGSAVYDADLDNALNSICDRVTNWKAKVGDLMTSLRSSQTADLNTSQSIEKLIHEGEEFNLKLSEIHQLNQELMRNKWFLQVSQMVDWQSHRLVRKNCGVKYRRRGSRGKWAMLRSSDGQNLTTYAANNALKSEGHQDVDGAVRSVSFVVFEEKVKKAEPLDEDVDDEEEEDDDGNIRRFTFASLMQAIADGERFAAIGQTNPTMASYLERLKQMHTVAVESVKKAADFLDFGEGVGFARAERHWLEELQKADWLNAEPMNRFRDELHDALALSRQFSEVIEGSDERRNFSLKAVNALETLCERSLFERNGKIHEYIRETAGRLLRFVERIAAMFKKTVGYYDIFEIISGRDDLTALVEGDPIPRTLFKSTKYNVNWNQLKQYHTSDLLANHLTAIHKQQLNLLMALRLINEKRSVEETCLCGGHPAAALRKAVSKRGSSFLKVDPPYSASAGQENLIISCFLCNATLHEVCAQWDPFFSRLPEGVFLCPRCLRGRRPCVEDVEAACKTAPVNSLERLLVANLVSRAALIFNQLQEAVHRTDELVDLAAVSDSEREKIKQCLIMALSIEVIDVEVLRMTFSSPIFMLLFPPNDRQVAVWRRIQSRMVEASPRRVIFPPLPSSASSSVGRRGNNKRNSVGALLNNNNNLVIKAESAGDSSMNSKSSLAISADKPFASSKEHLSAAETPSTSMTAVAPLLARSISLCAVGTAKDKNSEMDVHVSGETNSESFGGKRKFDDITTTAKSDYENCAAERCLRPYSDHVRWIQCESGCMRWYHYVCVGQTVKAAELLSAYTCYRCAADLANLSVS